jgi:hypothetical protein
MAHDSALWRRLVLYNKQLSSFSKSSTISQLDELRELHVVFGSREGIQSLKRLFSQLSTSCPKLVSLHLESVAIVEGTYVNVIVSQMQQLQTPRIIKHDRIRPDAFQSILKMSNVTEIDLSVPNIGGSRSSLKDEQLFRMLKQKAINLNGVYSIENVLVVVIHWTV